MCYSLVRLSRTDSPAHLRGSCRPAIGRWRPRGVRASGRTASVADAGLARSDRIVLRSREALLSTGTTASSKSCGGKPSRRTPRVDTIVLSPPTLVGATDVALPATGGGTKSIWYSHAREQPDAKYPVAKRVSLCVGVFRVARFRTARDDTGSIGLALPLRLSQRLVSCRRSCPSKQ